MKPSRGVRRLAAPSARHLGRDASLTCSVGAIIMILELLFVAAAQAAASPEGCEAESGEFVANRATAGGVIVGPAGKRIRLYRKHPALCPSGETRACDGKSYLVPGDAVDIGTACGDFVRVRYAGKSRVSIGWIDKMSLTARSSTGDPGDFLSAIEGYYVSGGHCWARNANGSVEPCGNGPAGDSCLLIKKIDATHAEMQIESFQGNGHECGVSGIAEVSGGKLIYVQGHQGDQDDGRGLAVEAGPSKLTIQYLRDEKGGNNPFCAVKSRRRSFRQEQ